MKNVLDEELLDGPQDVRIVYRPERVGVTVAQGDVNAFVNTVRYQCQIWGGANAPIIPCDSNGRFTPEYVNVLPGSAVDRIKDVHGFAFYDIANAHVDPPVVETDRYGYQLAAALFRYRRQDDYQHLQVVELDAADPWMGIYAACLGLLPTRPDSELLRTGYLNPELTFEDFVTVERIAVKGSLDDLVERVASRELMSPRNMSMFYLAYGSSGSSGIRTEDHILPQPRFAQTDAGPNVVVVCSPGSVEDLALLWNLRAAYGDSRPLPIGIPVSEAKLNDLGRLRSEPGIARNGFAVRGIYVTSASLSSGELKSLFELREDQIEFGVASYGEMLTLGSPGGWVRNEVVTWQNGSARIVPFPREGHREIFVERGFGDLTRMFCDIDVTASSFPWADDIRVDAPSSEFRAGVKSSLCSPQNRSESRAMLWPSRLLIAKSVASARGLELSESEPGRAGRIAMTGLENLYDLGNLAHAPLLLLLEKMAARDGFGWYKERLRMEGREPSIPDAIAPVSDELPEESFGAFKRVLGNSDKAARYWLSWAEKAKLIVKGFQLQCSNCEAKQWIPVSAFVPPIICRGCAEEMDMPFRDRYVVNFKYRLSERLRRVYKQDAIGHLLVIRYFQWLLGSGSALVGFHPGMDVRRKGEEMTEGEADVLMLTQDAQFVPMEVKRTSTGFTEAQVGNLNRLATALGAPWSVLATCQYGVDVSDDFPLLENRELPAGPRFLLSYDTLLDPHPVWSLGTDPFAWSPLDATQIQEREREFVTRLAVEADDATSDWLAGHMLRKPSLPAPPNND